MIYNIWPFNGLFDSEQKMLSFMRPLVSVRVLYGYHSSVKYGTNIHVVLYMCMGGAFDQPTHSAVNENHHVYMYTMYMYVIAGLQQEGIYRLSPSLGDINKLKAALNTGIHACTCILF